MKAPPGGWINRYSALLYRIWWTGRNVRPVVPSRPIWWLRTGGLSAYLVGDRVQHDLEFGRQLADLSGRLVDALAR